MPTAPSQAQILSAQIQKMSPPDRLRLAADLLDQAQKEGGNTRAAGLAHTIARTVTEELGAALALVSIKQKTG